MPQARVNRRAGLDRSLAEQITERFQKQYVLFSQPLQVKLNWENRMAIIQWIVAAGTAVFVALIAYLQLRTAQQRAALDLFDRRYELFCVFREAVAQMTRSSAGFDQQRERDFIQAKERPYFFFGDDVEAYLEELRRDIDRVRTVDNELDGISDQETRRKSIETRQTAFERIAQFHTTGRPLFGRYMRFSQPIPKTINLIAKMRDSESDA